jgi:hypothetical protein
MNFHMKYLLVICIFLLNVINPLVITAQTEAVKLPKIKTSNNDTNKVNLLVKLNDLRLQEQFLKIFATATQNSRIIPFYKTPENTNLPINIKAILKQIAGNSEKNNVENNKQNSTEKYFYFTVKENWENGIFVPKIIELFDEGTAENQYKSTYQCSFYYVDFVALLDNEMLTQCKFPNLGNKNTKQIIVKEFDLREQANAQLQRKGKEISRLLLKSVLDKELQAYLVKQNGFTFEETPLSLEETLEILQVKENLNIIQLNTIEDKKLLATAKIKTYKDKLYRKQQGIYYTPKQFYQLQAYQEINYNEKFDKKALKTLYLALVLPAAFSLKGIDEPILWFKAADCEKLFASTKKAKYKHKLAKTRAIKGKITYLQAINLEFLEGVTWEGIGFFE